MESVFVNPKLIALLKKGYNYQRQGNLTAAEKNYLRVLKYDRRNAVALNLMGVVCILKSNHADGVRYLQKALIVNPNDAETHLNLGLAHMAMRQVSRAQQEFERSLKIKPDQPVAWYNLGNAMASSGSHDQAIACFEKALALNPNYVDCLNNLSVSLKESGRLEHALQVINIAIGIDGARSTLYDNKGMIFLRDARYEEAREAFEQAIGLGGNIVSKLNLATALKQMGDELEAAEILNSVLEEDEKNTEAHSQLGILLVQMGNTSQAAQHFRRALELNPNHAGSFYELSKLTNERLTESDVATIQALLKDAQQPDNSRASLYFALAFEFEKREKFEMSFDYLLKGQRIKATHRPYDVSERVNYLDVTQQVFPVKQKKIDFSGSGFPVPIFVVGMPRSGTTLIEQIISSHSAITGAGEVGFINALVEKSWQMTQEKFPQSMAYIDTDQVLELRETYLQKMVDRFGQKQFIVDKNPLNFNFIGLIGTIFPEARIIYCKRNPLDNCVSIFRLPFSQEHSYAHDLAALGHYYHQHVKLMDFWKSCYADQILTVPYENVVEDFEQQARKMLEFIGVEFEDQVLSYFDNKRIVLTPSAEQVRLPIYGHRVQYWKRYEKHLGPLISSLHADTVQ
jgi:FimV-like protein